MLAARTRFRFTTAALRLGQQRSRLKSLSHLSVRSTIQRSPTCPGAGSPAGSGRHPCQSNRKGEVGDLIPLMLSEARRPLALVVLDATSVSTGSTGPGGGVHVRLRLTPAIGNAASLHLTKKIRCSTEAPQLLTRGKFSRLFCRVLS